MTDNIQKIFFETLKSEINPNIRLADAVSEILGVGSDSAYRRLRGEKELTLSELVKLCSRFNMSLDSILNHHSDYVLFKYSRQDLSDMNNYEKYMDELATMHGIKAYARNILPTTNSSRRSTKTNCKLFMKESVMPTGKFPLRKYGQAIR